MIGDWLARETFGRQYTSGALDEIWVAAENMSSLRWQQLQTSEDFLGSLLAITKSF